MKRLVSKFLLSFILGAVFIGLSGCASNEPENNSVRPWNAPQDWENGMPIQQQQHE
jgi:hypothetical protein